MVEIYYVYVRKIEQSLPKNYRRNSFFRMVNDSVPEQFVADFRLWGTKAIQRSENQSGNLFNNKHDFLLLKNTNIGQKNGIVSSGVMNPILKYSIEKTVQ